MESFYGGLNGQSFSIKTIFTTKLALDRDRDKGWASPVSIGEYVLVSYGMPLDEGYKGYRDLDFNSYGESYNSTLWQKVYNEKANGNPNGISYNLISSMTGSIPDITFTFEIQPANTLPELKFDNSNVENPKVHLILPKSQVLVLGETTLTDAGTVPTVRVDDGTHEGDQSNINEPILYFTLPRSQKISEAVITSFLKAGEKPTVKLDITDINNPVLQFGLPTSQVLSVAEAITEDADIKPFVELNDDDIDHPVLTFHLPQAQLIEVAEKVVLDADEDPYVTIDKSNINAPVLTFGLPQGQTISVEEDIVELDADASPKVATSGDVNNPVLTFSMPQNQIMADPGTTVKHSETNPSVALDDSNINAPKLNFTLPRAAAVKVGETSTPDLTSLGLEQGDFYLNKITGDLYKITASGLSLFANLQVAKPDIEDTISLTPYTAEGSSYVATDPTVDLEKTELGWTLQFGLPQAPYFEADSQTVGVEAEASVTRSYKDASTVLLDFDIPRGAKIYAGSAVHDAALSTIVEGALAGDIYINTDKAYKGVLYKYNGTSWEKQEGNIQGPVGDTLRFVASYEFDVDTDGENTSINTAALIEANYNQTIQQNDVFSVTWTLADDSEKSYWYYKTVDGIWAVSELTGGVGNFMAASYVEDANKTYNTVYTNGLIVGSNSGLTATDKTRKSYSITAIDELMSNVDTSLSDLESDIDAVETAAISYTDKAIEALRTEIMDLLQSQYGSMSDL